MDLFQLKGQRSAHQGVLGESNKELQRKSQFIENDDSTELRFWFKML